MAKIGSFILRFQGVLLGVLVIGLYILLSWQHIHDPFIRVSEDTNGSNGMAAYNWLRFGIGALKGGLVVNWLPESEFLEKQIVYYADHPSGFLIPTFIAYKVFGVDEWTTRVGPLLIMVLGLVALYWALTKIFQGPVQAFLCTLGVILLPGTVYYGKHLDMQPPALGWALISFGLFIAYYYRQNTVRFVLFLVSALIGCFVAWHYYFILLGIWLVVLFGRSTRAVKHRTFILWGLPVLVLTCFALNLTHIYLLGGWEALNTLKASFFNRSGGIFVLHSQWYKDVWSRFELNMTWYWVLIGLAGFLYFMLGKFTRESKELIAPVFIMPVGIILVFQSWTTHPFGPIYFLPIIGIGAGFVCVEFFKRFKLYGVLAVVILIGIGGWLSIKKLNYFYQEFLILSVQDIDLLARRIGSGGDDNRLCLGQNDFGLYYGGIVGWYIRSKPLFSPVCLEPPHNVSYALLFRGPREFYQQEAQRFLGAGFNLDPNDCAGLWCLVTRVE